ncbi:EGF-like domain-containing protein [Artemisia annua]|uniref:Receptor-like serine/threonine-protein kinase n=1 Tax=Artemisia annua TaxID=35608 RepID=A0A2U1KKI3_ARTAN|nr:EGF-like domain-containing protein [Artemisia annua]
MASLIAFTLTISLAFNIATSQSNITRGSSLSPNGATREWLSPSGLYAFGFYPQKDGYALGIYIAQISPRTVVWTASRDNLPLLYNATLLFTTDGRLVIDQAQGQQISIFDAGASIASMQDSGNFVLYDSQGAVLWQTFDYPTDTLLAGQRLVAGNTLFSSVSEVDHSIGVFKLAMQLDGHLVLYPNVGTPDGPGPAYWASGTAGKGPNVTLNLHSDGFLYLLQNSTYLIRNLTQGGYPRNNTIYRMKIDVDGIFRLYSHDLRNMSKNGSVIWASSNNKCAGKGLCGVNGYCEVMNDVARCRCLPGYEFVNPELWSMGCQRNYTVEKLYSHDLRNMSKNGSVIWASSNNKCAGKGLCGVNGYCEVINDVARCRCLPGYEFVNPELWSMGCQRNYTVDKCKMNDLSMAARMAILSNARWEEATYEIPEATTTQQECSAACLNDCNCEVALFSGQACRLQRLPLRFMEVTDSESNVGLIKVYIASLNNGSDPSNPSIQVKKTWRMGILVTGVSLISISSLVLLFSGVLIYKTRVWAYRKVSDNINSQLFENLGPRAFSYAELERITDGFKEELGRGSFGIVYKGSLADIIFEPKRNTPCWAERITMAIDIAHGILYLHEECETAIIHCDIKPQNILMDEYNCAKISDFGLAKLLEHDQTRTSTLIRGTRGYVAPEWYKKMPITVKVDVYSFGIVLFEILCCRRSVENNFPVNEAILEEWVYDCYEADELSKLVDGDDVDKRTLDRMVKIGLWCIQEDPSLRPSMKKVILMLEGTVKIPVPPNPASFLSVV